MAYGHLDELRVVLERCGWRLIEDRSGDDYRIAVPWVVERTCRGPNVILDFDGLDDLQVLPLDKAYACHVRGNRALALYFSRRGVKGSSKRSSWKEELRDFVDSLGRLVQE